MIERNHGKIVSVGTDFHRNVIIEFKDGTLMKGHQNAYNKVTRWEVIRRGDEP
jgi:hypothetical protein